MRSRDWVPALSLALSLAALVALEGFSQRIAHTLERDSRNFLAADYRVQGWRPLTDEVWKGVATERARGDTAVRTDFIATAELGNGDPVTANVSAIAGPYPFYGAWRTEPQLSVEDLRTTPRLLADSSLESRGAKVGDAIRIGAITFTLAGFLREEPQTVASAFATGPRLIIHESWAQKTALLGPGSRAFRQLLVRSSLPEAQFRAQFRAAVPDPHWRLITPDKANRQASGILQRIRGFLSFVLLSGLFLGGVGVFMTFRSRFLARLPEYLTLRCLGMKSGELLRQTLREALGLAASAWIPGVALGFGLEHLVAQYAHTVLDIQLANASFTEPALLALIVAVLLVGLAVMLPLREILRVPVQQAFRENAAQASGLTRHDAGFAALTALTITLLVARSFKLAAIFLGSLSIATLIMGLLGLALLKLAESNVVERPFTLRHATLSFARMRGSSLLLIVTTGLGLFLLCSVLFVGHALRKQIDFSNRLGVPNIFLLGLTESDLPAAREMLPRVNFVPVMQSRLAAIKGEPVQATSDTGGGDEENEFYRTREYVITKRTGLAEGERVLQGATDVFGPAREGLVRVSLEQRFADGLNLHVGDTLQLELAGVQLPAEIRSLRKVDWFNLRPNFYLVVNADDVSGAPFNYVGIDRAPIDQLPALQRSISRRFPGVTALDGDSIAKRLLKLLDQLSVSVSALGSFALGSCAFVFVGLVLSRRQQKLGEFSLFRCLGVSVQRLHQFLAIEFFVSGLAAGLIALVCALGATAALCRFVLDVPLEMPATHLWLGPLAALPLLTSFGGWIMMRSTLQGSALSLFRAADEA
ncbi:MAG: FtsX-like permease family protein [Bdellovibrionales bacterium]|nr:FtsX-like permease family protein [Bdellovibrionales bacterium]